MFSYGEKAVKSYSIIGERQKVKIVKRPRGGAAEDKGTV